MNVLLCPDSFKDALSAQDAAAAMARGVKRALPSAQVQACPLADGGAGCPGAPKKSHLGLA